MAGMPFPVFPQTGFADFAFALNTPFELDGQIAEFSIKFDRVREKVKGLFQESD
jgi:hypothetical protein